MSLLEKAKGVVVSQKRKNDISEEHIEVALAWLNDEIHYKQADAVIHPFSNRAGTIIREAFRQGKLKVVTQ